MARHFIVYPFSHTTLVVDTTDIGLPTEVYPPEGKLQMVPSYRFQSWRSAEKFLLKMGADAEALNVTAAKVAKGSIDVLMIV
jgi:hypothetical protein